MQAPTAEQHTQPATIRALRAELDVTNAEITERTGYAASTISRAMRSDKNADRRSQPAIDRIHAALCEIRDERLAAAQASPETLP